MVAGVFVYSLAEIYATLGDSVFESEIFLVELDPFFFIALDFSVLSSNGLVGNFLNISFIFWSGGFRWVIICEKVGKGVKF